MHEQLAAAGHAARETPPRWRAPAATERADAVRSWPRAGHRHRRHEARGPAATTKHEAYRHAEWAAAGHCGGSARAAGAGRRGSRPSVFFPYFLEIEMLIGLYGLYLVMDSLNDLLDLLILYGRFNIW